MPWPPWASRCRTPPTAPAGSSAPRADGGVGPDRTGAPPARVSSVAARRASSAALTTASVRLRLYRRKVHVIDAAQVSVRARPARVLPRWMRLVDLRPAGRDSPGSHVRSAQPHPDADDDPAPPPSPASPSHDGHAGSAAAGPAADYLTAEPDSAAQWRRP